MTAADILRRPSEITGPPAPLGFGVMRQPSSVATLRQMIYMYMDAGFNYFDTAYVYNNSEEMLKSELEAESNDGRI